MQSGRCVAKRIRSGGDRPRSARSISVSQAEADARFTVLILMHADIELGAEHHVVDCRL
jgi:hypothetical protein